MTQLIVQAICRCCGAVTAEANLTREPTAQIYTITDDDILGYPFVLKSCCASGPNPVIDLVFSAIEEEAQ